MRLKLFVLAVCGLFAGCLQAQVGVYVLATGQHMSSVGYRYTADASSVTPPPGTVYSGEGHFSPLGFTGGAYYDFFGTDRFRFGVDLRGGITSSKKGTVTNDPNFSNAVNPSSPSTYAGGKIYSTLAGFRGSMKTHVFKIPVDPYAQVSAGLIRTNYGVYSAIRPGYAGNGKGATGMVSNFGVEGMLGADVQLAPAVALRLEAGTGAVFAGSKPSALAQSNFEVPSAKLPLQSYSIGIVFRFHRNQ